jgi:hypothetical protein
VTPAHILVRFDFCFHYGREVQPRANRSSSIASHFGTFANKGIPEGHESGSWKLSSFIVHSLAIGFRKEKGCTRQRKLEATGRNPF